MSAAVVSWGLNPEPLQERVANSLNQRVNPCPYILTLDASSERNHVTFVLGYTFNGNGY